METIDKRLKELEGKELEGEELKEWGRLVNKEYEINERRERKQEERQRKRMENVPKDMEAKTSQVSDISNMAGTGGSDSVLSPHTSQGEL